jgi:N6-L-threonylcarbamoyladenine synthase
VSGGHTQLVLVKKLGDYKILGETRDDAAGECFDKVAKLLGLGYPGGPAIAKEAKKLQATSYKLNLPRPMIKHKSYDFSFSGLKTAVLYTTMNNEQRTMNKKFIQELCHETQQAIIDVLIEKTIRAAKEYRVKTVILSGGVAANDELRKQLSLKCKVYSSQLEFLTPSKILCTDNAAMIAAAGYFGAKRRPDEYRDKSWKNIKADANLRIDQKMR